MKTVTYTRLLHKLLLLMVSGLGIFLYSACTPPPDAPAPSTPEIIVYPDDETTSRQATFNYYSETGAGALYFKCKLNGGSEFNCGLSTWGRDVSHSLVVPGGRNTFSVRTVDDRGKSSGWNSYTWLADDSAPIGGNISGPSFSNKSTVTIFKNDFYDSESGVMEEDFQMQSAGVQASTDCTRADWSRSGWDYVDSTTMELEDGCYRFRLFATNNLNLRSADVWHYLAVDTTPPTGGAIQGPAVSERGDFELTVTNFTDAFSGIKSNTVQMRTAPLSSANTCPTQNSQWSEWSNTSRTQSGLSQGCYQYRLVGVDNGGLQSAIRSTLTRVKLNEEDVIAGKPPAKPGNGTSKPALRILSLIGPAKAKQGKKALYTLRIRNAGEALAKGVTAKAYGNGVSSAKTSLGNMLTGVTRTIKSEVIFKKKGKIKLVFIVQNEGQLSKKVVQWVQVKKGKKAKKDTKLPPQSVVDGSAKESSSQEPLSDNTNK